MFSWLRGKRDGKAAFEPAWADVLRRNVWQYNRLDAAGCERVHAVVAAMRGGVRWEGAGGFDPTDEAPVTIAGVAALVTLGLDEPFVFPKLPGVLIYPGGFRTEPAGDATLFGGSSDPIFGGGAPAIEDRSGEAWLGGPIVLSWADVLRTARAPVDGENLVLHEFAHHLDGLDGDMDGVPAVGGRDERRRWYAVTESAYRRLVGQAERQEASLLDHYGATNPAEFFAIATECFFERPHALRAEHAELYGELARFYRQSPADWLPEPDGRAGVPDAPGAAPAESPPPEDEEDGPLEIDVEELGFEGADADFARAWELLEAGEPEAALRAIERTLADDPEDAEALRLRGRARYELGDDRAALADAEASLAIDPDDPDTRLLAAEAAVTLGEDRRAEPLVRAVLKEDRLNVRGLFLRGLLERRAGDDRAALGSFGWVLRLDPHDAAAHRERAAACERLGQAAEAAEHLRRADELYPAGGDPDEA